MSSPQPAPATPGTALAAFVNSHANGKLEISRAGSGLMVRLINPKDGTAKAFSGYTKEKANCKGAHPCYIFSAINGTAPMPEIARSSKRPTFRPRTARRRASRQ